MKINEVTTPFKTYIASVRVITGNGSTTARTTITADTQQQARLMLARLYGVGNVISISDVMHEAPESHQIQRRATNTPPAIHTQLPKKKNGPIQLSCVSETEETKTLSPAELQVKSLADQTKRLDQQAKLKKAQTGLAKAQEKLRVASRAPK
jgi:hypothetical protein